MSQQASTRAATFSHHPAIPPQIRPRVPRVDPAIFARLQTIHVPDISDAVGPLYTMVPVIGPLYAPMPRLVGQALTAKVPPGDNLTVHGALALVEAGDVLVIDSRGYVDGCATGASVLALPLRRGLRGAVVDGAWRDIGDLRRHGVPVFGRVRSAFSPPKARPGEINVPVSCGGVVVQPGDVVVADEEGVVVIPQAWIETVLTHVEARAASEAGAELSDELLTHAAATRAAEFNRLSIEAGGQALDLP